MKEFSIPLYGFRFFMSNDLAEVTEYLKAHGGDLDSVKKSYGTTPCWDDASGERHRLMAVFDGKAGTIAHEAVHMAWETLSQAGINVDGDNNEAQAYLVDWLLTTFLAQFPS